MNRNDDIQQRLDLLGCQLDTGRPLADVVMTQVRDTPIPPSRGGLAGRAWVRAGLVAVAVLVTGMVGWNLLDGFPKKAYAFDDTIEASHSVKSIHLRLKTFSDSQLPEPAEVWLEFGEDGKLVRARADFVDHPSGDDVNLVWSNGKASIWSKSEKQVAVRKDTTATAWSRRLIEEIDPKLCVERLQDLRKAGQLELAIRESADGKKPNVVTATFLPHSSSPGKRLVALVDPATRLVTKITAFEKSSGEYRRTSVVEIIAYNVKFGPKMFALDVPDDVRHVDISRQEPGLLQGTMSDEEVAAEVVRQTFQAMIDRDFEKAARLARHGMMSADALRTSYEEFKPLRIVSISKATAGPEPGRHENEARVKRPLSLTCTIERERNGKREAVELKMLALQVKGHPDRWTCMGDPAHASRDR